MRSRLSAAVTSDLVGPGEETDEVVYDNRVRDRYLVGMLAPEGTVGLDPERDDDENPDVDLGAAEADESDDPGTGKVSLFPSSLGLSFAVEPGTTQLEVVAEWGEYDRVDNPTSEEDRPEWQRNKKLVWQREHRDESATIGLPDRDGPVPVETFGSNIAAVGGVVEISGRCETGPNGHRLITLFLRNRLDAPEQNPDRAWLFQPRLTVRLPHGTAGFVGRTEAVGRVERAGADQREQARLDLQYRHQVEIARGHAVSVHPTVPDRENAPGRASELATTFLPTYEVPNTKAASGADTPELADLVVEMGRLADASVPVSELQAWLAPLADGYGTWLQRQRDAVSGDPALAEHADAAADALDDADEVAEAIRAGIDLLAEDDDALTAFRFANATMREQRLRIEAVRRQRDADERSVEELVEELAADPARNTSWRPFQLAFILLNLPSLVRPDHRDRAHGAAVVDLLFFPTGGGKTEAYLGLVSATFALRRLKRDLGGLDGSDGVAVLMRYTLRLLTAQQFERAAALVAATELVRRQDPGAFGSVPFRLGLYVGGSLTPNRTDDARKIIVDMRGGKTVAGASPVQLSACPWCGTDIDPSGRSTASIFHVMTHEENVDTERTVTYCPNEDCPFCEDDAPGEGIPVVTVDDEVYRTLPTFVIGTIDKFAQLPWNPNARMLFGHVSQRCARHGWRSNDPAARYPAVCTAESHHPADPHHPTAQITSVADGFRLRPPDLIIQDEFHLITGPLGTISGLYETAVDRLSAWQLDGSTVHPKVVASTATIRRANDQVRQVFARGTRIFPPQVTDVRDTFFARQVPTEEAPGRLYVGICAQGRSFKEAETAVFQTVMGAAQKQWEEHGAAADPWMTTVGYFSAIRELASMRRIADDQLPVRLRTPMRDRSDYLSSRFITRFKDGSAKRWPLKLVELTSRVGSADLRAALDDLNRPHQPDEDGSPRGTDLVLATNMISVGVDVPRLGLMVVAGQPKTTAEYIQSSSRVGRSSDGPGLVLTVHNWARPRDLSHWETFEHYHSTFYRHVEAQSVTPFADRALDRVLTAVLVSLLRGEVDDWTPDRAANRLDVHDARADGVAEAIIARAREVDGTHEVVERVRALVQDRLDDLKLRQGGTTTIAWQAVGKDSVKDNLVPLLQRAEEGGEWGVWTMPMSMRNVEPGINVLVRRPKLLPPPPRPSLKFGTAATSSARRGIATIDDEGELEEVDT
ncbi:DISARM system helicase DrmA [Salsipaludibacter albus]|uniref:DISARM system helicase DrmA n=1 Tax=Salsipaludibacter albus TaxID=2849650 RepID=UPI001EE4B4AE|nr:DISARM system helicase DrmA [Salsipaludibacter albus]MBY5162093.1 DISARM system helicase DrmA [Salsipaludibacter albus]